MGKRSKAYEDRLNIYQDVEKIYKYNKRFGSIKKSIEQLRKKVILAKVYWIIVVNFKAASQYKKSTTLYDSVTYSYLHIFKNIRDGNQYDKNLLIEIRKTISTIERCVRFIKSDHPHMFNYDLIKDTNNLKRKNIETYGNNVVMGGF